jgi:hypothetical protein
MSLKLIKIPSIESSVQVALDSGLISHATQTSGTDCKRARDSRAAPPSRRLPTERRVRAIVSADGNKHDQCSSAAFSRATVPSIMTHLDSFLQRGPVDGNHVAGLEELRRIILLDGIPANSEGMVRSTSTHRSSACHRLRTSSLCRGTVQSRISRRFQRVSGKVRGRNRLLTREF